MHKKEDLLLKSISVLNKNPNLPFADICKEIGIARATAYKNFKDKDDLLVQISNFVLDEKQELIDSIFGNKELSSESKLEELIIGKVKVIENYYFLYNFSQVINNDEILKRYYDQYSKIGTILQSLIKEGKINSDIDISWSLYALDGLFYAGWYGLNDGFFGPRQIEKNIKSSFFNQIGLK